MRGINLICSFVLAALSSASYSYVYEYESYLVNHSEQDITVSYIMCDANSSKKIMTNCENNTKLFKPGEFMKFNLTTQIESGKNNCEIPASDKGGFIRSDIIF